MRWLLAVLVGFLAFIGVGASLAHYLTEPYNPGFLHFPTITALHVILGGIYLALAPFQFVRRIRNRFLAYHRWVGRLLVALGLVIGVTALFMGLIIPYSGWTESVYITLFGSLFLLSLYKGFVHIRAKRVELHREWMMRAFAIGLSIATMRLIFIPALIITANPTDEQIALFSGGSFIIALIVHSLVAELWIRNTRKKATLRSITHAASEAPIG